MPPILSLNIKYLKNKDEILLRDISFTIEEGKIYCILGKNGSGKTTLLKYISGLLDKRVFAQEGSRIFMGEDMILIEDEKLRALRRKYMRYVFQDALNSFDPLKKIGYYFKLLEIEEEVIDEELRYFLLPAKEILLKMYPYELSGGMAQRVSFILAISSKPKLLIMDEPTSGIDTPISNLFKIRMREFTSANNSSIILVTQDILFAQKVSDFVTEISNMTMDKFVLTNQRSNGRY